MSAVSWLNFAGLTIFVCGLSVWAHGFVHNLPTPDAAASAAAVGATSCLGVAWPGYAAWSTLQHIGQQTGRRAGHGGASLLHVSWRDAALGPTLRDLWRRTGWLQLYFLAEAGFLAYYFVKRWQLQRQLPPGAPLTPAGRRVLMDRALAACPDRRAWLSGWFQGAPVGFGQMHAQVWRGNAEEWVAWCLFGKHLEDLSAEEGPELQELLAHAERRWQLGPFPPGYNESLRGQEMRLSLEPVRGWPRPLLLYLAVAAVNAGTARVSRRQRGFVRKKAASADGKSVLHFWYRPAHDEGLSQPPVVLLHGIGPGASIVAMMCDGHLRKVGLEHAAVIVPELRNITYSLDTPKALDARRTAAAIAQAVRQAQSDTAAASPGGAAKSGGGALVLGQSFGTIVLTWLLRHQPEVVGCALFLDPVVFLLHHAALCHRFLYRPCRTAQQRFLRYFAGDELSIQHYLRRHFVWHDNVLFLEDIPPHLAGKVCVVVGEADTFIDAPMVIKYLRGEMHGEGGPALPMLVTVEGADHGGWMASGRAEREVLRWVQGHLQAWGDGTL